MEHQGGEDDSSRTTLVRVGRLAGYVLLGVVGTAVFAIALLFLTQPIQKVIYNAVYLQLGPSEATETAILTQFIGVATFGITASMLLGEYLSTRFAHRDAFAKATVAMLALVLVFLLVALAGLAAFITALIVLAVGFIGIPLSLRYRYMVRSGGIPAFVGGIPVVIVLLLLAGFGLGWGWGYVVTAQEIPASAANGTAVADFDDAPEFRDDLFAPQNCEMDTQDRRRCLLTLRGYEYERAAARFMARHGVRCPYQNAHGWLGLGPGEWRFLIILIFPLEVPHSIADFSPCFSQGHSRPARLLSEVVCKT